MELPTSACSLLFVPDLVSCPRLLRGYVELFQNFTTNTTTTAFFKALPAVGSDLNFYIGVAFRPVNDVGIYFVGVVIDVVVMTVLRTVMFRLPNKASWEGNPRRISTFIKAVSCFAAAITVCRVNFRQVG